MGDAILLSPLVRAIQAKHKPDRFTVIVDPEVKNMGDIFRAMPEITHVEYISRRDWTTESEKQIENLFGFSPIPECVRNATEVYDCNGQFLMYEASQPFLKPALGIADFWLRFYGFVTDDNKPKLNVDSYLSWAMSWKNSKIGNQISIGIVPSAGHPFRDWDIHNHLFPLVRMIRQRGWVPVIISEHERFRIDQCEHLIGFNCLEVAAALTTLNCIVTPDTGILHLAESVGAKTVSLWGLFEPRLRSAGYNTVVVPHTPIPCSSPTSCIICGWSCMKQITAPMIMGGITQQLGCSEITT